MHPVSLLAVDSLQWSQLAPLPEALGVAAPFAGVTDGKLLVAGGANFPGKMPWEGGQKVWLDTVWLLDQADGAWREVGKLPRPLAYGISVTTRDGIVCAGGSDAGRHHSEVFRLSWTDGRLRTEPLPRLPVTLSGASGALVGDTLYVACGAEQPGEQKATNFAFALDLSAAMPAWRKLPELPGKARILAAAAAYEGAFYVMGGAALESGAEGKVARTYLRDAWVYREDMGWKQLADLPRPSVAAASPAPVVNGHILLLAGDDGSRVGFQPVAKHPGFPDGILAYDPVRDRWAEGDKVPAPRATVPCVEWNGRFIVPSGEVRPGVRSPEIWRFQNR